MHSIKINREELLRIVKENKETHITAYAEAVEDYKAAVLKITTANLKVAKTGDLEQFKFRTIPSAPTNYADNYTKAIRMLELSVEDVIEIDEHIFNQLVLDEWGWKQQFTVAASSYKTI